MIPQAIVFDLGKVLVDFDYARAASRMAGRSTISAAEIRSFIDHSPLLCRYETGLISTEEFFAEVCRRTGFSGSAAEFAEYFADIFTEIPGMIAAQAALRRRNLPTFIFSNTNPLAVAHIRARFPFFAHFDRYILSFEHRVMKPDAKLYEVVEREAGCRGAGILYLDDRRENVEAGARRGWQTVLHESPETTLAAMRQLGLPV